MNQNPKTELVLKFYVTILVISLIPIVGIMGRSETIISLVKNIESFSPLEIAALGLGLLFDFFVLTLMLIALIRRRQIIAKFEERQKMNRNSNN